MVEEPDWHEKQGWALGTRTNLVGQRDLGLDATAPPHWDKLRSAVNAQKRRVVRVFRDTLDFTFAWDTHTHTAPAVTILDFKPCAGQHGSGSALTYSCVPIFSLLRHAESHAHFGIMDRLCDVGLLWMQHLGLHSIASI